MSAESISRHGAVLRESLLHGGGLRPSAVLVRTFHEPCCMMISCHVLLHKAHRSCLPVVNIHCVSGYPAVIPFCFRPTTNIREFCWGECPSVPLAPAPGSLVHIRGSRSVGLSRVIDVDGAEALTIEPCYGRKAGKPISVPRRKAELLRGRGGDRPAILLCSETESFRLLARSQLLPTDAVLELGCSYGEATALIAKRAASVLAIDVSADAIERAAVRCAGQPNVRFNRLDCVKRQAQLLDEAVAAEISAVFIDINGNRASKVIVTARGAP